MPNDSISICSANSQFPTSTTGRGFALTPCYPQQLWISMNGKAGRSNMFIDLSTHHQPIGGLFSLPQSAAEWDRYKLSDEQVAFYHEHGYLAGVRILSDEQIEKLRAELSEFF